MTTDRETALEETRARFCSEVKRATRQTGISAGAVATFAYPLWGLFDHLVEPDNAADFLWLRLGMTVPIAVAWLGLVFAPQGRTHPELFVLALMTLVNLGIALMIPQVETHHAAYALGMSLTIYAAAFLLIWSPRYMAGVVGLDLAVLAIVLLLSDPVGTDAVATIGFYLGTASLLAFLGQYHRQATAWHAFETMAALEHEQERTRSLVQELDRLSHEDSLTGLANRRAWDEALARECARAARERGELAILLCDLDQLKAINDQLGHPVGDVVLKAVGRVLNESARAGDLVARLGGDEFAVLCPGADLFAGTEMAERLRVSIEERASAAAAIGGVSISIGVADWEGGDDSAETLMLRADRRLYRAKATRNVVCAGDQPRI